MAAGSLPILCVDLHNGKKTYMKTIYLWLGLIIGGLGGLGISGCGTTKTASPVVPVHRTQALVSFVTPRPETAAGWHQRQHLFQELAAQEWQAHAELEKQHRWTRIDAAYWTERAKEPQEQNWQTPIALAEDYLRSYPEIDQEYLDVEEVVMAALSHQGAWHELVRFIEASAHLRRLPARDPHRASALRMHALANAHLGNTEAAKTLYRHVITAYPEAERDGQIASEALHDLETMEDEQSTLRAKLQEARAFVRRHPPQRSLTGLGQVPFAATLRDVRRVVPHARFDWYGTGECTYSTRLYGCLTWEDTWYGYPATVTVQFISADAVHQMVITFGVHTTNAVRCLGFRAVVLPALIKKYGDPRIESHEVLHAFWSLKGGSIEYHDACVVGELLYSTIALRPASG